MRKLQANKEYLLLGFEHVLINCQAKSPLSKWVSTVRVSLTYGLSHLCRNHVS